MEWRLDIVCQAISLPPSLAGYAGAPECVSEPWVVRSAFVSSRNSKTLFSGLQTLLGGAFATGFQHRRRLGSGSMRLKLMLLQ